MEKKKILSTREVCQKKTHTHTHAQRAPTRAENNHTHQTTTWRAETKGGGAQSGCDWLSWGPCI